MDWDTVQEIEMELEEEGAFMHEESQEVSHLLLLRGQQGRRRARMPGGGRLHARGVTGGEPRFTSFCRFGEIGEEGGVRTRGRRAP